MNTIHKVLSEFGLEENETRIYLEAIRHREISPFKLARLTGIPRSTVYSVMASLALKGLITVKTNQGLEKQQTWIVARNPSVLREMIFRRRRELTDLEVGIVDILPDLKKEFLPHRDNGNFRFYPGKEGIERVYRTIAELPKSVPVLMFDHLMPMDTLGKKYINEEVSQALDRDRVSRSPAVKTIMPLNDWTRHVLTYQYGRDHEYIRHQQFRYLDYPFFKLNQDIYILPDRVLVICAKDDELWGAVMESRLMAATMKSFFDMLWVIAAPVTKEFVEELGENEFLKAEKRKK